MVGYLFIHLTCSLEEPPPLQRHLRVVTELHTVCKRVVRCFLVTVRNEVAKVMFLQVSMILLTGGGGVRGVPGPGGAWSRGRMPGLGGCLVLGGAWSRGGCLVPGGVPGPGGLVFQHALRQTPSWERRPLLRTVRILLECILILTEFLLTIECISESYVLLRSSIQYRIQDFFTGEWAPSPEGTPTYYLTIFFP